MPNERAARKTPTKSNKKDETTTETPERELEEDSKNRSEISERMTQQNAIRRYLQALDRKGTGHRTNPRQTVDTIDEQLDRLNARIDTTTSALKRLQLEQQVIDLRRTKANLLAGDDMDALEAGFVEHVQAYSQRKGLSYAAWREAGVQPRVLRKAGMVGRSRPDASGNRRRPSGLPR
jgi:hypothetical protein